MDDGVAPAIELASTGAELEWLGDEDAHGDVVDEEKVAVGVQEAEQRVAEVLQL